ncbi:FxSxx-COOH system tetratricopeptide repeat protein [Streptomyces sp. NPDC048306]|uniref:FxSxx-COOH system tetratricopeptide repeat protein n=1 Tax=Streptomyces sp. NPDC048306 TaxID=3154502 RepID=UPI0033FB2611
MTEESSRTAWDEEPEPSVTVRDTGHATAAGDELAVTGYRGPAPGGRGPVPSVKLAGTGDAIASGGGTAISGYVNELTVMQQAAPRERASWPHQVGVIPPRAQSFQHRAEVEQLRATIASGGTAVLCQVLMGTGGVGKTQLAADYARAAWESGGVDVLVWITASTNSAAVSGYAQAGVEVLGADPQDPEQAAKTFLAWLEPKPDTKPCRWLVVLDDLADPADLRGLWPPANPSGRTLVTTRRRDAALTGPDRRLVTVGLFTPEEAVAYLTANLAAHHRHEPADELTALAADLGHLPLALAQAAAYLIDSGLDCAAYRQLLADRARTLADVLPEPGALPDDQATTVAAAWSLSIERADRLRPAGLARPMLQLAAMLDPNGIPASVLAAPAALGYLTEHRTPGEDTSRNGRWQQVSVQDSADALRCLHRLSLIDHTPATAHQTVRVHNLIQRAVRDSLPEDQHDRLARTAADALTDAWPDIEHETALAQALRANAEALTSHAEDALWQPDAHEVLFRTGQSLRDSGQVTAATAYFGDLAVTSQGRLGPDHSDTLTARSSLARCRGEAGDAVGAAAAYEQLIEPTLRLLGPGNPSTFAVRSNLAHWLGEAGDVAAAVAAYEELVEQMLSVLGPHDRNTLIVRSNFARWQGRAGDAARAAAEYEAVAEQMLSVLGPHDRDTLIARGNLAAWRGVAGDAVGAVAEYEELLKDMSFVFAPDHPEILTVRNDLARFRGEAGNVADAVADYEALLHDQVRVLSEDHPDTLTTRHGLAHWRGVAGDAAGAVAAYEELVERTLSVLGPDHPHTLITRNGLAGWQGRAGDVAGAVAAYEELVEQMLSVLGPDHPHTLIAQTNLAEWREAQRTAAAHLSTD